MDESLKELHFESIACSAQDLITFLTRHSSTLRTLRLDGIYISTSEDWVSFFKWCVVNLHLTHLFLRQLEIVSKILCEYGISDTDISSTLESIKSVLEGYSETMRNSR